MSSQKPTFSKLPQPLFFTVIDSSDPGTTTFINAAHVVRIDIEAVTLKSGTLHLVDGSKIQLDANAADWVMRLMAANSHEQGIVISEFKKMTGQP